MKKFLLIVAAIFCCTIGANAQETPDYFCITVVPSGSSKIKVNKNGSSWTNTPVLEYSLNGIDDWTEVSFGTDISVSSTIYLRAGGDEGKNATFSESISNFISFSSTNVSNLSLSGNIMSLLQRVNFEELDVVPSYAFYKLIGDNNTFYGKLTDISDLRMPASKLGTYCYRYMFAWSSNITSAPEDLLPAEEVSEGCYYQMFSYCSNLTTAPKLPAETLVKNCYYQMFNNCKKLTGVNVAFTQFGSSLSGDTDFNATYNWLSSAGSDASVTTFTVICPENLDCTTPRDDSHIPVFSPEKLVVEHPTSGPQYLCLTAKEDGAITLTKTGEFTTTPALEYSKDGTEWTNVAFGSAITVANEELLYIRAGQGGTAGTNSTFNESLDKYISISSTGDIAASGCIMSLFNGDEAEFEDITEVPAFAFCNLFAGCTTLSNISKLRMSVTTLAEHCFNGMFSNTGIATIPATLLPATTLAEGCYEDMFRDCESLTTVPTGLLPATTLQSYCYTGMFEGCAELTSIPATLLPATTLATYCYKDMFMNCSKLATIEGVNLSNKLIKSSTMQDYCCENMFNGTALAEVSQYVFSSTSQTLAIGCFKGMFANCNSLTTVYNYLLASTTLAIDCYNKMFQNCVVLDKTVSFNYTSNLPKGCYESMYEGCIDLASITAFISSNLTLNENSCKNMFKGCVKLATLPTIKIYNVAESCCESMFEGCVLLENTPTLSASTLAANCYANMFKGCEVLETAPVLNSTSLAENCYKGMFSGCVALTTAPALPATTLAKECYANMFDGCILLAELNVKFTSWPADESEEDADYHATYNWLNDVAEEGTFISPTNLICEHGVSRVPEGWLANPVELDDATPYTSSTTEIGTVTYNRTFAAANVWQSLYVPFSIKITSDLLSKCDIADIYMVSTKGSGGEKPEEDGLNVTVIKKFKEGDVTEPHTPYFIRPKASGDFTIVQDNTTLYAATEGSVSCATTKDTYDFIGNYSAKTLDPTENVAFYIVNESGALARVAKNTSKDLAANRWYMKKQPKSISAALDVHDKMSIIVLGEDDVTGIEGISLSPALSTREGVTYNLQGQRVNVGTFKGIAIKGGKKFIVK